MSLAPSKRPPRLHRIRYLGLIPLLILAMIVGLFFYRETIASRELTKVVNEIRQAGEPVDNASMAKRFEKHTYPEGTEAWSEILSLVKAGEKLGRDLPFVGNGTLPVDFKPGCEWPDEERIAGFLEDLDPIIMRTLRAADYPTPVRMPIQFEGIDTLLPGIQEARSIVRLLELDAHYAMYHQDHDRTLRDIRAIDTTSKAFDWRICVVTSLVRLYNKRVHRQTINQSLSMNVWNESQISLLVEQVRLNGDVRKLWEDIAIGERAIAFCVMDDPYSLKAASFSTGLASHTENRPLRMTPLFSSGRLNILHEYRAWMQIGEQGFPGLHERASAWEQAFATSSRNRWTLDTSRIYLKELMPSVFQYAIAIDEDETLRRLTLTSLAVKKFQLSKGRWPKKLSELKEMGLGFDDWTTLDKQSFGYSVEEEVAHVIGNPIQVQGSQAYDGEDPWRVTIR